MLRCLFEGLKPRAGSAQLDAIPRDDSARTAIAAVMCGKPLSSNFRLHAVTSMAHWQP
jgi:hypothetical protein